MAEFMKEPCEHCPFRRDVRPFLTPERGEQLAYHAYNPYNDFPCHKTTVSDEDDEGFSYSRRTQKSKECAGFISFGCNIRGDEPPKGFIISDKVYEDTWEMCEAYENPDDFSEFHKK